VLASSIEHMDEPVNSGGHWQLLAAFNEVSHVLKIILVHFATTAFLEDTHHLL
jgi:hypothetical protein